MFGAFLEVLTPRERHRKTFKTIPKARLAVDLDLGGYLRPSWRLSCTLEISIQSSQVLSRHVPKDSHAAHPPVDIRTCQSTGHIVCFSINVDGRSMSPDSRYRNALFHFPELGLTFHVTSQAMVDAIECTLRITRFNSCINSATPP